MCCIAGRIAGLVGVLFLALTYFSANVTGSLGRSRLSHNRGVNRRNRVIVKDLLGRGATGRCFGVFSFLLSPLMREGGIFSL